MSERTADGQSFGVGVGTVFAAGLRGFVSHPGPLLFAGAATLGTYMAFRLPAQRAFVDGELLRSILLDLAGMILASVVAAVWYSYALQADRGGAVDSMRPFRQIRLFGVQAVASFWFWAGFLLGLRYLYGLPSIVVLLFYSLYGFVVADVAPSSGLKALGTSVRLGQGRRLGLFAFAGLFTVFNLVGAIALGFDTGPVGLVLAFLGVTATASITLVSGARIYRVLSDSSPVGAATDA